VRVKLNESRFSCHLRLGTTDWHVLREVFLHDQYGFVVRKLSSSAIKYVVDLGANIGISILLWRAYFPDATILGVEPHPSNLSVCRLNLEETGNEKVILACLAVGGTTGSAYLDVSVREWSYRIVEKATNQSITIQTVDFCELIRRFEIEQPIDLLKCDIEGAEWELFGDCRSWVHKVRYAVVELHGPKNMNCFVEMIRRQGIACSVVAKAAKPNMALLSFSKD
jgi:FkbM family methyltransferase